MSTRRSIEAGKGKLIHELNKKVKKLIETNEDTFAARDTQAGAGDDVGTSKGDRRLHHHEHCRHQYLIYMAIQSHDT